MVKIGLKNDRIVKKKVKIGLKNVIIGPKKGHNCSKKRKIQSV